MDKSLLIHFKNTPLNVEKLFFPENIINFSYDNHTYSNIDEYISKVIIEELKSKNFDLIYIKDTLSLNYLELYGLLVAYHIRLSQELKHKRYIPIVILSDIDGFTLNRIVPMAKILFSKNIFLEKNSQKTILKYQQKNISLLTDKEYSIFLNNINVEAPENSSNHSIANEWAIDRWATFLDIEDKDSIQINKDKISSMLYFKYLTEKYKEEVQKKKIKQNKDKEGRILFIDDKGKDGWNDIVKNYISKHYDDKKLECKILEDYNEIDIYLNMDSLKIAIENNITKFDPHIILLDLRLLKNEDKNINKISGIQLLDYIKTLDKSIQIIMFSASSDSLILDALYNKKILGYVKKDIPTDKYEASKNSFKKLNMLIKDGLEKSYLKEVWKIQKKILELDLFKEEDDFFKRIKLEIYTIFEILNSNIENKIKFTLITIFKILEILTEKYNLNGSEFFKIKNLFHNNGLIQYDEDISHIVCTRNFLVHSGNLEKLYSGCKANLIKEPNKNHILEWFEMLQSILEKIEK